MHFNRLCTTMTILASAATLSACNTDFNKINQQFSEIKAVSKGASNSTLPAAAIATNIAAVELIGALSQDTQSKIKAGVIGNVISAGGGNVITPGGGNVITPGAGNYALIAVDEGTAPDSTYDLDESTHKGTLKTVKNGKAVVDVTFDFQRNSAPGELHYAISNLKGKASGFDIQADGKYDLTGVAADATGQAVGDVACKITGSISSATQKLSLDNLSFHVHNPMPDTVSELGAISMSDDKNKIDCTVGLQDRHVIAKGTLKDAKGNLVSTMTLDENGPHFEDASGSASK